MPTISATSLSDIPFVSLLTNQVGSSLGDFGASYLWGFPGTTRHYSLSPFSLPGYRSRRVGCSKGVKPPTMTA